MPEHLKILSARVTNFGPFRDTEDVPMESDVTVLLAENENGKTSFLRALDWFSSGDEFDEDDRWDGAPRDEVVDIVALTFEMNSAAKGAFRQLGLSLPSRIRVVRQSDGLYRVSNADSGEQLSPAVSTLPSFDARREALVTHLREMTVQPGWESHLEQAVALAEAVTEDDQSQADTTVAHIKQNVVPYAQDETGPKLDDLVGAIEVREPVQEETAWAALQPLLPTMIYFGESVEELNDVVAYEEVASDPDRYQTMTNLASLVGEDIRVMADLSPHERQRRSRTTSTQVSERVSSFWAEGGITLYVTFEEARMVVSVTHKERDQKPSRRSRGLRWFLGFFINFKARTNEDLAGAVLLLDEPGIFLHLKQQPKLLDLFDDLARSNQIVYSTQLPKMVPAAKLHRLRLLVPEPKAPDTVTVKSNVRAVTSKADVMQPVRAQLGMGIADAISLGNVNVIVEGWIDPYLLDSMRMFCRGADKTALAENVTVFPTGGAGKKMLPHVALHVGDRVKGAVLVDDDRAGHAAEREIKKAFGDFVPTLRVIEGNAKPSGAEIEDLFTRAYYLDLTNAAYAGRVNDYANIALDDLEDGPVVDAIQSVFEDRGYGRFQKIYPARELQMRLNAEDDPPDDESLTNFAELFERLNRVLK